MSVPARRLVTPPEGVPSVSPRRPAPARTGSRPRPPRQPDDRGRRVLRRGRARHHLGFAVLAGGLVASMVFGIVVVNVLLAQTSFRIDRAERRIEELSQERLELVRAQATLSAPGRIAAWAHRHGMRLPDDIRILHVPTTGSAGPAGADTSSSGSSGGPGT